MLNRSSFFNIFYLILAILVGQGSPGVLAQSYRTDTIPWESYSPCRYRIGQDRYLNGYMHQKTGEILIPPRYSDAGPFSEGKAWVVFNGESGYIDKTGQMVLKPGRQYNKGEIFSEGFAAVKIAGKQNWVYIDTEGKRLNDSIYFYPHPFNNGKAIVCNRKQKYGCINSKGVTVINFEYDYIEDPFINGVTVARRGGQAGLIDTCGNVVFDFGQVDGITRYSGSMIVCTRDGKSDILTSGYQFLTGFLYDQVYSYGDLFVVVNNNKRNFVDNTGKLLSGTWFDDVKDYKDGIFHVSLENKPLYIDTTGHVFDPQQILPEGYTLNYLFKRLFFTQKDNKYCLFDLSGKRLTGFYDRMWNIDNLPGLICVRNYGSKDRTGFLDLSGHLVTDTLYDHISIRDDVIFVKNGDREGLLDTDGNLLVPCIYERVYYGKNHWPVKQNGKYNFTDRSGNFISGEWYDDVSVFSERLASVKKDGKWGAVDEQGNLVIPCRFKRAFSFKNGVTWVWTSDSAFNLINRNGKLLIPEGWSNLFRVTRTDVFSNGYLAINKQETKRKSIYNYIDTSGNFLIPEGLSPDYASDFRNGFASVCRNGEYILIDTSGKSINNFKYHAVGEISGSIIPVCTTVNQKKLWGYIDCNHPGQWFIEPGYQYAGPFSGGLAIVKENSDYRIIALDNEKISTRTKLLFKTIHNFTDGVAWVEDYSGEWGFINVVGEFIVKPQFDAPAVFHNGVAKVRKKGERMEVTIDGLSWPEN